MVNDNFAICRCKLGLSFSLGFSGLLSFKFELTKLDGLSVDSELLCHDEVFVLPQSVF